MTPSRTGWTPILPESPASAPFMGTCARVRHRDQRDLMERPFFALAKTPRLEPMVYHCGNTQVRVYASAQIGMATIWDADILIWAVSQIVQAQDRGHPTAPRLRVVPFQMLRSLGRGTNQRAYALLRRALDRLHATMVTTTLGQGEDWQARPFRWISDWRDLRGADGRVAAIEMVLPDWLYAAATDRSRILSIDPAYFRLTGGLERWLYRVARKHAGRQPQGWMFELSHLHQKSGSQAGLADFVAGLRRIIDRQSLPGYRVHLAYSARRSFLEILPRSPGDRQAGEQIPSRLGTSVSPALGRSLKGASALQTAGGAPTTRNHTRNRPCNLESNSESNAPEASPLCGQPALADWRPT